MCHRRPRDPGRRLLRLRHAHPDGPIAGAKAFRQAIDIGMKDMKAASEDFEDYVEDHAEEYPELARAMETWGVSDTRL